MTSGHRAARHMDWLGKYWPVLACVGRLETPSTLSKMLIECPQHALSRPLTGPWILRRSALARHQRGVVPEELLAAR